MNVQLTDTASPKLRAMAGRVADLTNLMAALGRHMTPSIRKNFDEGGRPNPWAPLASGVVIKGAVWNDFGRAQKGRMTRMGYRVQGRNRSGGPLVLTGDLRDNIGWTAEPRDLVLWARPKNNAVKAPVHQFGTARAGRHHNVTIPARPYLVFQREDLAWFRASCDGWIRVGRLPS